MLPKKHAVKYGSQSLWEKYQNLRNKVNIEMYNAKSNFFTTRLEKAPSRMILEKQGRLLIRY